MLSRITEPTAGYADVYGRIGSLLEVGTGFHKELTGRENVYLNGAILGMERAAKQLSNFDVDVIYQSGVPPIVRGIRRELLWSMRASSSGRAMKTLAAPPEEHESVVFPDAPLKIYLVADVEERGVAPGGPGRHQGASRRGGEKAARKSWAHGTISGFRRDGSRSNPFQDKQPTGCQQSLLIIGGGVACDLEGNSRGVVREFQQLF